MSKVEVKLNLKGINEVMKSGEIQSACENAARAVGTMSGIETDVQSGTINYIAYANVYPATKEAAKENFEDNTLLKAVSSVGLKLTKGG